MNRLLLQNSIDSVIQLSPDSFNFEIALAILDILALECDHYLKVEDYQAALVTVRNLVANHIDKSEDTQS